MAAKEIRRPAQAGLQVAGVVGMAGNGCGHQAVGAVVLTRGVDAERAAHIGGRAGGRGQGGGLVEAGAAHGQAGAALQCLGDQAVQLGIAQGLPPIGGGQAGIGACLGLGRQTQVGGAQPGQWLMGRALGRTTGQGQRGAQGGRCGGHAAGRSGHGNKGIGHGGLPVGGQESGNRKPGRKKGAGAVSRRAWQAQGPAAQLPARASHRHWPAGGAACPAAGATRHG